MLFFNVLLAALSASIAWAHVVVRNDKVFGCGTEEPSAEHRGMSMRLAATESRLAFSTVRINVYFHIIASGGSVANGNLTNAMISSQLRVLNGDFAPYGFGFRLAGTDRTYNSAWAMDTDELNMKRALRKGSYRDLNIYFQPRLARGALGYATLPVSTSRGSPQFIRDGVSLDSGTVPGGSRQRFNKGKTGTHEIGHWLGLYHTFQGGCNGNGDFVDDTPAQASASNGCPIGRNSCPNKPGLDPIHNYMDYSDDACYEEFTPGQQARMHSFWTNFRA